MTSDIYIDAVRPFVWLLNKYWSNPPEILVAGFTPPKFDLPSNATFFSIGNFSDYPLDKWSDSLLVVLNHIDDEHIIIMLEDYWIVRPVDDYAVRVLYRYAQNSPDVIKVDLAADRLFAGGVKRHQLHIGYIEILESDRSSAYHMSLMTGLWNVNLMKSVLEPGWTPWDVEMSGTTKLSAISNLRVVGTGQWPILHTLAFRNNAPGKLLLNEIKPRDIVELRNLGMLSVWE
jgi:hypothetical protein